jgi:hypothetical protein
VTATTTIPNGRNLTKAELKAFEPQFGARTHDEEIGYRRGFDQGVAALAYALGINNESLQRSTWKQRVKAFRSGKLKDAPWSANKIEQEQLRQLVFLAILGK